MADHLSAEILRGYQQRTLTADALLAADDHLTVCAICRELMNVATAAAVAAVRADFAGLRAAHAEHLTFEQLAELLDAQLAASTRAQAEAHLQICASCADEWADLRAFSDSLAHPPAQVSAPPLPAPALFKRLRNYLKPLLAEADNFGWFKWGALATGLLLIGWGAWQWRRSAPTASEIARSNATPSPTIAVPDVSPTPLTNAPVLLALKDGATQLVWQADGKLAGAGFVTPADERRVQAAWQSGSLETPALPKELRAGNPALMGSSQDGAFRLQAPLGEVTLSDRPLFQWQALPEATSYTVTALGLGTDFMLTSPALTANRWTPPRPLPRGRSYAWQVVALRDGMEVKAPASDAPEGRFHVAAPAAWHEVTRVRRAYPGQRLLLGLTYARYGLLKEAETELQALAAANPQAEIAQQWLRALRVTRRSNN